MRPFIALALLIALCQPVAALQTATAPATTQDDPHAGHVHPAPETPVTSTPVRGAGDAASPQSDLPPSIPPVTDADRAAAFPDAGGHLHNDHGIYSFVLIDRLEWQAGDMGRGIDVDASGWIGRDSDRLWFRVEGDGEKGRLDAGDAHALYGHQFSRWWDVVVGVRQDVRPGPAQTWAAVGIQGLAPYWFDVEATMYIGASGRTQARLRAEYDLLLTNRLIVQPLAQVDLAGRDDPRRKVGAGLSSSEVGFRLRYEIRREVAPYIGVTWNRQWGNTATFAAPADGRHAGPRFVIGARIWR